MIFLLFLIFPFAEVYTYYKFIEAYSFLDAVLFTMTSGILGVIVMSSQGRAAFVGVQAELAQGKIPANMILHRAVLMLGGLLLFIPGILSDVIGLLCIMPGTRHLIVWYVKFSLLKGITKGSVRFFTSNMGGFTAGFGGFGQGPFARPNASVDNDERDVTPQVIDVTPKNKIDS